MDWIISIDPGYAKNTMFVVKEDIMTDVNDELELAAENAYPSSWADGSKRHSEYDRIIFKHGAKWQAEQDKARIEKLERALWSIADFNRVPNDRCGHQMIARKALERP